MLLVVTDLEVGGTGRFLVRLARGLASRGHAVRVACLAPRGPLAPALEAAGVPVLAFGARSPLRGPGVAWALASTLRRSDGPRVVASFLFHANAVACAAAVLARARGWPGRLVTSLRWADHGRPWHRRLESLLTRLAADRTTCVSEAVRGYAERALGLPAARTLTIPNGVPIPAQPATPDRTEAPWLLVSRLDPDKRPREAIEAWRLRASEPGVPPLVVVGGGAEASALRAEARGLPVRFLGRRPDVEALLLDARGLVLPVAPQEGCPNALLEAMAAGLPVVTSRVPGTGALIEDGATGILVPPGNPQALADAIGALDRNPAGRRALGEAARAAANERFSARAMIDRYEALFRSPDPVPPLAGAPASR